MLPTWCLCAFASFWEDGGGARSRRCANRNRKLHMASMTRSAHCLACTSANNGNIKVTVLRDPMDIFHIRWQTKGRHSRRRLL